MPRQMKVSMMDLCKQDGFEDIRIRISKKNRQHSGQKKKDKRTNNDLQNIHIKLNQKGGGRLSLEDFFKQLLHHSFNITILNSTLFTNTTFDVYSSISTNIIRYKY